ncbi:hypothetical protein M0654_19875 [Rhizobium sp. NTR19]|uniref:Uncharacterized protein n=1 Tax=Neorhizobium turbinariae TaxID=2937795 RepID=A0ABT0IWH8_9HYPH|nr:hypothetical protein [Neorhizobium turbinariae]MCK8782242.1 hypothetical protein [Neorhizobium turbinariae]
MKLIKIAALLGISAVSMGSPALAIEPIPGSITFGGQPMSMLMKAPIGSTVPHRFFDRYGQEVEETYRLDENRNLQLIDRRIVSTH